MKRPSGPTTTTTAPFRRRRARMWGCAAIANVLILILAAGPELLSSLALLTKASRISSGIALVRIFSGDIIWVEDHILPRPPNHPPLYSGGDHISAQLGPLISGYKLLFILRPSSPSFLALSSSPQAPRWIWEQGLNLARSHRVPTIILPNAVLPQILRRTSRKSRVL